MPIAPIHLPELIIAVVGGLTVLLPVAGITVRIALKPIAEAIARVREAQNSRETVQLLERRLALLEQEVQSIGAVREEVHRLAEAVEFDRRLSGPR